MCRSDSALLSGGHPCLPDNILVIEVLSGSMRSRLPFIFLFFAALLPSTAFANAGTPLMWATMGHLVIGNALIGTVEGLLVSALLKTSRPLSGIVFVGANYASAWIGGVLLTGQLADRVDITIENLRLWFCLLVLAAFVLTLLIEFPFCWLLVRKQDRSIRKALKATLLINLASYLVLFGWYWAASGTSMLTQLEIVPAAQLRPPKACALWFISRDGKQILRGDLAGEHVDTVREVSATHRDDRLFARVNDHGRFDLLLHLHAEREADEKSELVLADFAALAPIDERRRDTADAKPYGTWFNFGAVPSLGAAGADWRYRTGFWAAEGLSGVNEKTGERVHLALEIPFAAWMTRNAVQLDGGLVLLQLGHDQICLLQPTQKKIALVARGKGPLVAQPGGDDQDAASVSR